MKNGIVSLVTAFALLGPVSASAYFEYGEVVPEDVFIGVGYADSVTHRGNGRMEALGGFGQNMPLMEGLRMIVPLSWKIHPTEAFDDIRVNWSPAETWGHALSSIGNDEGLRFVVDWNKKAVFVGRMSKAGQEAVAKRIHEEEIVALKNAGGIQSGSEGGAQNSQKAEAIYNEIVASNESDQMETDLRPEWILRPGSLRLQMEEWAEKAGYKLVWALDGDIIADAGVVVRGTLIDAVSTVFKSLAEHRSSAHVSFKLGNVPPVMLVERI